MLGNEACLELNYNRNCPHSDLRFCTSALADSARAPRLRAFFLTLEAQGILVRRSNTRADYAGNRCWLHQGISVLSGSSVRDRNLPLGWLP
jgi:hypothetical protein